MKHPGKMPAGGHGGSAHRGNQKMVKTNRQTLKSGGKMEKCGNDGNTKGTTLPMNGAQANAKGGSNKGHMDY